MPDIQGRDLDGYDVVGYRALVEVTPEVRPSVRSFLRGFGPLDFGPGPSLPRYDLVEGTRDWHIRRDGTTLQIGVTRHSALDVLEWHLVADALNHRRDLFHLHGAALSVPGDQGAIVLTGDSGSGKTTLTLGLMLRGCVPFTDDVTLLDPAGLRVEPLRRVFRVSENTRRLLEPLAGRPIARDPDLPPEDDAPPHWAAQAVPVRWVFLLEYRPDQSPQLVPLSSPEAAATLLAKTSSLTHESRLALSTCARLTERATCYRLLTGNLEGSLAAVQELVRVPLRALTP